MNVNIEKMRPLKHTRRVREIKGGDREREMKSYSRPPVPCS